MPSILAGGLGSGIDINGLVSQLVAAERAPTASRLDRQELQVQARISSFGTLRGALAQFESALAKLGGSDSFIARSAVSGDIGSFTVSATAAASTGNYDVRVVELAESHKLSSAGLAGADTEVGTGTLRIGVGDAVFSVTIDSEAQTLAGIRDAINGAADNKGVSAALVNSDAGTKLVLTATKTGTAGALTLTVTDDGDGDDLDVAGLSRLVYDPAGSGVLNMEQAKAAKDAVIELDGETITRSGNTISDALDGITLTLKSSTEDPVRLTVDVDPGKARLAIESFVKAFNGVAEALQSVASFNSQTRQASPLFGDAGVRGLQGALRQALGAGVQDLPEGFRSLAELGVTTGADGLLAIDSARLDTRLGEGLQAVTELFTAAGGYTERLQEVVQRYTASDGLLSARTDGLNSRLEGLNAQRETLGRRMEALQARLLKQFIAMDTLVSRLQSTGSFLTQQIDSLQALNQRR